MLEISTKKQGLINLLASLIVFLLNLCISFFLSPFIVRHLGVAANGYIQLANNFISYAALVTITINSMASRFITVAIYQGKISKAKEYYSSSYFGSILALLFLFISAIFVIWYLPYIIEIPFNMENSVRSLFSLLFLNYFISLLIPNWAVSTFSTNKLHIQSIGNILSNFVRTIIIFICYLLFPPRLIYIGIAAIISTLTLQLILFLAKQKLLPDIKVDRRFIKKSVMIELVSSGIWNTLTQVGMILLKGLDLLISNIVLGAVEMGILSLAKIFPTLMSTLAGTITSIFAPDFTIYYAKGEYEKIVNAACKASKITTLLMSIPYVAFISFGDSFFNLWIPSQNANQLQILSMISGASLTFTIGIQVLFQVFPAVNKLKLNALVFLASSVISIITMLAILNTTNLGLYAIVGVSASVNILRNLLFVVPVTARYLGIDAIIFYKMAWQSIRTVLILFFIGFVINSQLKINTWINFVNVVILFGIVSLTTTIYTLFSKKERKEIFYLLSLNRIIQSKK